MKATIILTSILSIFALNAVGQVTPNQTAPPKNPNMYQNSAIQVPDNRVRIYSDRMTNDLKLNENQAKQLHDFNTNSYNNHQILIQNHVSGAERSRIEESNQVLYDNQIRKVLSEDQYNFYNSRRADYRMEWNAGEVDLPTQDLRGARKPVAQPGDFPAEPATEPGILNSTRPATQPQNPNVPQAPVPTAPR